MSAVQIAFIGRGERIAPTLVIVRLFFVERLTSSIVLITFKKERTYRYEHSYPNE